ncbi:PREDICTED: putative leucine-rich repeat-containing protein DDB_G0290503 isoform X1 [Diuraphis noxia]|uniref:putative leucine-rich repeat-containing protein DDB_G0290503 isoform X1 n=1 Tax=Diuraphis noxia TaxID=143948 RepID=UPI0007636ED8|nr:PREDICTED: putative leucine-rich repeat-containing protein DDB_G0290503 isoform X1 [Diuraphis noxia]
MELELVHDAYKKELERVCEKHQIELDENEQRHRNEIQRLCAENASEISNLKLTLKSLFETELVKIKNNHEHEICELKEQFEKRLNDLKDCDLDTLTKRIEDDITKTHAKHKKIVSYLVNEIYKLKKTIINSSFDDVDRFSSIDSFDPKLFQNNLNGHDADIETSDYVLSQDSIDMQIKDLEDIVQERDDLRSVATTLRQLSKYLCSFLLTKQEELNNSIVERMNGMKCGGVLEGGGDRYGIESTDNCEKPVNEMRSPRRVHFIPNIEEIVSLIDEHSVLADFTTEGTSEDHNHLELNSCLKKLNDEAAALSDVINNEQQFLSINSDDICYIRYFDKKIENYKKELEKQRSEYKKLFMENSALEQENVSLKEQLEKESSDVNDKKQYNDIDNENLILLKKKAQELIKNYNDWPNLQIIFDEFSAEYNKIIENIKNDKDDLAQQLDVADRRLKSSQKFIKDQIAEREVEREEFDSKLETLKFQLKEKERESLDTEDLRSHTEQVVTEAEERYIKLENRCLRTEELLNTSKLEVLSLKNIILNQETRIENLIKNEISQKNSINQLTNMLEEEQNNQQDMLTELNRLKNLLEEQIQNDGHEFADIEIVINKIRLQLKDVEKTISKRIKDLDTFWVTEECGSPMSEDISVAERCELPNKISIEKNSSPARIVATLDDVFIRLQERLNRLFKSEDAIFKHESDQQNIVNKLNKQVKSLESEVDMLRTRLAEKSDQLITAKMKIDELRVLKNDNVHLATSQLQEKLQKITIENKQCSQIMEEQNHEIRTLKDSTKYFKNMLSAYETKLAEKENIDPNTFNNLESKVVHLAEENISLQINLASKISEIEALSNQLNSLQNTELTKNDGNTQNHSVSKSIGTDMHISENEQMRRAIPNESNTLPSLQMSYHHQDISMREPSIINLSLPSQITKDNTNIHSSISEELKSALANTKLELEEKNALIKVMEKDTELMDQQLKELKESIKTLTFEKNALENHNHTLIENETLLTDKLNDALTHLDKKQETLSELETLGVKLRAEIQPLVYMKDVLEKKISAFKDCNKIQSERIDCLENINSELLNECDNLKKNQKDLEEIKSIQQDNWTLKNELLNNEKFKVEVNEKLEKLKNENDVLKSKNLALIDDIENLKLDKYRLKNELEKNEELHADELVGYQNLLAEEQNKKHQINMELLKTIEELTIQASEQHQLMSGIQENKELEVTCTFSDFSSENFTPNLSNQTKDRIKALEIDLENERKKTYGYKINIENKDAEIEQLNIIKRCQELKITDYMHRIKVELETNTKLELNLAKLENHIKELENKIEIFKAKDLCQTNDNLVEKLENDLVKVLDTNEMLDKELTRILDIKEETDQHLIEAYKKIAELETQKNQISLLLEQLDSKNQMIETFKHQLDNADIVIKDQQAKSDKDKRLLELKLLDLNKELKESKQKYQEIVNDFEIMKHYVTKKKKKTEEISEKNDNMESQLNMAEKTATEWQKKYNDLLNENCEIKLKFEILDAECGHLQNKITELQHKLTLSDHYKNRLMIDIQDITTPADLELKHSKLILNLETENVLITKKLTETREKYNKCRAHLEDIKTMLTSQNLKNIAQANVELCNTRDKLQNEVMELKCCVQDLNRKLLEKKVENHWPVDGNQRITRVEALYHSLVWQKMYLVKLARGKDKLLRFIIQEWPDLDNSIVKTMMQRICAKRKMSKFKIVAISLIAINRMRLIAVKQVQPKIDLTQSQLNLTHYNLPKKMPWIKC